MQTNAKPVLTAASRTVTITPGATNAFATLATGWTWTAAAASVGGGAVGLLLRKGGPQHHSLWFGVARWS